MYHLKLKGSKKSFQARNITGAVILISDKTDFKPKLIRKDREYTTYSSKENSKKTILNIHASNTRTPKFLKETWLQLKSHTNPHTLTVVNFNIPLSPIDRPSRQKRNENTGAN